MRTDFSKEEATKFFSELYGGEHHIPNYEVKQCGYGWCVMDSRGDWATFDFKRLTWFVLMCHRDCIRGELYPIKANVTRVAIWGREREGPIDHRHPTIEEAIEQFNSLKKQQQ